MSDIFLVIEWSKAWGTERSEKSKEELAAECMGFEKWEPVCAMKEPFIHNVVSTSKVRLPSNALCFLRCT
jgi:hypothetical protein